MGLEDRLSAMEDARYLEKQEEAQAWHEALCRRCGYCCGLDDNDPCRHLTKCQEGNYSCAVYGRRLGHHHTVSGKLFSCVPIREWLRSESSGSSCAYAKVVMPLADMVNKNLL